MAPLPVKLRFRACRPSRGDDSDNLTFAPIAVTDQQQSEGATQTEQNKSIFLLRMVRIVNQSSLFIEEYRPCVLEGNPVLA
jgi:hypothetical protein